jgi:hypothetical protein
MILLSSLAIPPSYEGLIQAFKQFKTNTVLRWRDFSHGTFIRDKTRIIESIQQLLSNQTRSASDTARVLIGAMTLVRYSGSHGQVDSIMGDVQPTGDAPVDLFMMKCFARMCRDRSPPWDCFGESRIRQFCGDAHDPKISLLFVEHLLRKAPATAEAHSTSIFKFLQMVAFTDRGSDVIGLFTKIIANFALPGDFIQLIAERLKSDPDAAFLAAKLADRLPPDFPFTEVCTWTTSEDWAVARTAIECLLLSWHHHFLGSVIPIVFEKSDLQLIALLMEVNHMAADYSELVYRLDCGPVLSCPDSATVLRFVKSLRRLFPDKYRQWQPQVASRLFGSALCFADAELLAAICIEMGTEQPLCDALCRSVTIEVLDFLARGLVQFDGSQILAIADAIIVGLRSPDRRVRCRVAECLACLERQLYRRFVKQLVSVALTDGDSSVRLALLKCIVAPFPDEFYESSTINCLALLLSDQDEDVRLECARLLTDLGEVVILRKMLTIDETKISLRRLAEVSSFWPRLYPLFVDEYAQLFPKFIVKAKLFLESRFAEEYLTVFEMKYRETITASYLKTIEVFSTKSFQLVRPEWKQLIDIFLELLACGISSAELLALLSAIRSIAEQIGVVECRNHPTLYSALFRAGSKICTPDIHAVLFKILGYIGVMPLPEPRRTFWMDNERDLYETTRIRLRQKEGQDLYYFRHSAAILLGILKNEALTHLHRQSVGIFLCLFCVPKIDLQPEGLGIFGQFLPHFWRVGALAQEFNDNLELFCSVPADWLVPHIGQLLDLIKHFGCLRAIRRLSKTLGVSLAPHLSTLVPFLYEQPFSESLVVILGELAVNSGGLGQYTEDILAFLISLSQTRSMPLSGIRIIVQSLRIDSLVIDLLKLCLLYPSNADTVAILSWLFYRNDISIVRYLVPESALKLPSKWKPPPMERRSIKTGEVSKSDIFELFQEFELSKASINEWFHELLRFCAERSPNQIISAMAPLARSYDVAARNLITVAFHSVFASFSLAKPPVTILSTFRCVGKMFSSILSFRDCPVPVVVCLITLIEFMDTAGLPVLPIILCHSIPVLQNLPLGLRSILIHMDKKEHPSRGDLAVAYAKVGMLEESHHLAETSVVPGDDCWPDSVRQALNALTRQLSLSPSLDAGFDSVGREGGPRFSQGFSTVIDSIVEAQQLTELRNLKSVDFRARLEDSSSLFTAACHILLLRIRGHEMQDDGDQGSAEKHLLLRLARKAGDWAAFRQFFNKNFRTLEESPPEVRLDYAKYLWETEDQAQAIGILESLRDVQDQNTNHYVYYHALFSIRSSRPLTIEFLRDVSRWLENRDHPGCYRVCAWTNFKLASLCLSDNNMINLTAAETYATAALRGFAKCVEVDSRARISHLVQLLTITFVHRVSMDVASQVISSLPRRYIVEVINHIISRQNIKQPKLLRFICDLLRDLIIQFPYEVAFPCLCSVESDNIIDGKEVNRPAIKNVVNGVTDPCACRAFRQARRIIEGLSAVAMPLFQFCYDGLLEIKATSTQLCSEPSQHIPRRFTRDVVPMLLERLDQPPTCDYDREFRLNSLFTKFTQFISGLRGPDGTIDSTCATVHERGGLGDLHKSLNMMVKQEIRLKLSKLSTDLAEWKETDFPVFGLSQIFVVSFDEDIQVIASKQRPRKITVRGTDGHQYAFLLKSHEDLRVDERAIQFFSLMNSYLRTKIPLFAIVPFTSALGIIQWVPQAVSFYELIRNYQLMVDKMRTDQRIETHTFWRFLGWDKGDGRTIVEYHGHSLAIHKLEAFRKTLNVPVIAGELNALRDMMWLYAPNSETWLRYQMNYSKSMAVMSMVGHILGLGDRHVMNMMLEQTSGRVVHIDFGDCFESAQDRPYYREFVPFRLTRMMVAALGPTGFDGMFTTHCEQTMMTVRQNRESILALLEIFAQSPVRESKHMRILPRAVSEMQHVAGKFDQILKRIAAKVNGTEFTGKPLPVSQQVALLIQAAKDPYNLCQHFHNWHPWW